MRRSVHASACTTTLPFTGGKWLGAQYVAPGADDRETHARTVTSRFHLYTRLF